MSLLQFWRIIWSRRLLILAAAISCVAGAYVVTLVVPPRWTSTSRVLLGVLKPDPVTGQIIAGPATQAYIQTQVGLITDYSVVGQVADQLGWLTDPNLISKYNARSSTDTRDFRRWIAQLVIDHTKADVIEGSNILEINYTSASPEDAKAVANALRTAYIDTSLAFRRSDATRTADWYDKQTLKTKAQLDSAETALTKYERANNVVMANDTTDVDSARLAALAADAAAPGSGSSSSDGSAAVQLAEVDAQIAQAQQTLGANHPDLIALRAKRAALAAASGTGNSVKAQAALVMAKATKIARAKQLQAEVSMRRDLYDKTSAHAAQLRQEAAVADTGLTPLGAAVVPDAPSFPNMPLIMIGSLGLGLVLGMLVALLVELLNRKVRGPEDLETVLDAPLLAVVFAR